MAVLNLLYKSSQDTNDYTATNDNIVSDGYHFAQNKGILAGSALGAFGVYKGKGFKDKAIKGAAGMGAGVVGTFLGREAYDAYKRHQLKNANSYDMG